MDRILPIIQTLIVLAFVIVLAYFSLKSVNKYMTKQSRLIKVIDRVGVSNNSALSIVEIAGKYYRRSFSQNDNRILKELDQEAIEATLQEIQEEREDLEKRLSNGFRNIFSKDRKF